MRSSVKNAAMLSAAFISITAAMLSEGASVDAAASVPVTAAYFPDSTFRSYVSQNFDTDKNGTLSQSEIAAVTYIDVSPSDEKRGDITDLSGIEYFPNLKALDCGYNSLRTLDISGNTALDTLYCHSNYLTSLDISKNTELGYLYCRNNYITSIDISNNTNLWSLNCSENRITSLDVINHPSLMSLNCSDSQLTNLTVRNCTDLQEIDCSYNMLTKLDVSTNKSLRYLYCSHNKLSSLDVSNYPKLERLECYNNQLSSLTVNTDGNSSLILLHCYDNKLKSLDLTNNKSLEKVFCSDNQLESLNVENDTALNILYCYRNQLSSIDLATNTALESFSCSHNKFRKLDVSNNLALKELGIAYNLFGTIDLSNNSNLTDLDCSGNSFSSLDLSTLPQLTQFYYNYNQFTSMDFSKNPKISATSGYSNAYAITPVSGVYYLSNLKGFDPAKASDWRGAEYDKATNSLKNITSKTITYTYDCGRGQSETFYLLVGFTAPVIKSDFTTLSTVEGFLPYPWIEIDDPDIYDDNPMGLVTIQWQVYNGTKWVNNYRSYGYPEYASLEDNGTKIRCVITCAGKSSISKTITVSVKSADEVTLEELINEIGSDAIFSEFINSFTERYDAQGKENYILTEAQLFAIEKTLEYDYKYNVYE